MKKLLFIGTIVLTMIMFGCTTDQKSSQTRTTTFPSGNNNGKITKLQDLIDSDDVQKGTLKVIDLSDYSITDYNATINKALTIKNGSDLKGASLKVVTNGVILNGIQNVSVNTQVSMKISNSSLSSLSINEVSRGSDSRVGSTMLTEHESASRSLSSVEVNGSGSSQPPVVEAENIEVAEDVSVGIANAYLNVKQFTAKKNVILDAVNVQLTINDRTTDIKEIKTDKICQVILEDGTSDTIPTPDVTGNGELKQINMKAAGKMKLLALTPMSGLDAPVAKQGEAIDFGSVVVLGTYRADDGITLFKANGITEELTETFSKLEKNFTITIKDKGEVYKNGKNVSAFDWANLSAGKYTATLDTDYQNKETESYCPYQFSIVIIGASENETEIVIPTFSLTAIEVNAGMAKTVYKEGEPLNLAGLIVLGTYMASVENVPSYQSVVSDYTLTPPNGTALTVNNTSVTVTAGTFEGKIDITVKPVYVITFVSDLSGDVSADTTKQKVVQGEKVTKPTDPIKTGWTFDGWYEDNAAVPFDFDGTIVSDNIKLTARWTANTIAYTFNAAGGQWDDGSVTKTVSGAYNTSVSVPADPTRLGWTFDGWDKTVPAVFGAAGDTFTARWTAHGSHNIEYKNTKGKYNPANVSSFLETETIVLYDLSADGYTFDGWFDASTDGNRVSGWEAGQHSENVELWARWTVIEYTITYTGLKDGDTNPNKDIVEYTVEDEITLQNASRTGYTFNGWYNANNEKVSAINKGTTGDITLTAQWTVNKYKIHFDNNGGTGEMADQDATCDNPFVLTKNLFTRTGYTFGGWASTPTGDLLLNDEAQVGVNLTTVNNATVTLYAKWEANKYDIIYKDQNNKEFTGNLGNNYPEKHTYGSNTLLVNPTKENYRFDGWYIDSNCTENSIDHIGAEDITADITLYAHWTEDWTTDASGDFVWAGKTYEKTALTTALPIAVNINGSGNAGVFIAGRKVTLLPYKIGKYEVTQELYQAVTGRSQNDMIESIEGAGDYGIGEYNPMYYVSWYDAIVFCNKLSRLTGKTPCYRLSNGKYPEFEFPIPTSEETNISNWYDMTCDWSANGYRLPTEAEWEFAARGGDPSDTAWNFTYSGDSSDYNKVAICTSSATGAVGTKSPNSLGIYDMSGNLWEWCWDWYNETVTTGNVTTPIGAEFGDERCCRGGGFGNAELCSVFIRADSVPDYPYRGTRGIGFRLVQNIPKDLSLSDNRIAKDSGNFVIDNIEYKKTALTDKIMDSVITVIGADANWSGYATEHTSFCGAFIKDRNVELNPYRIGKYEVTQELFTAVMHHNPSYFKVSQQGLREIETDAGLRPVEEVSWYDAIAFCNKLSLLMNKTPCYTVGNMTDTDWAELAYEDIPDSLEDNTSDWNNASVNMNVDGYRLPTECEWEFAARGGDQNESDWYFAFAGINVQSGHKVFNNDNYLIENDSNLNQVGWYPGNSSSTYQVGLKKPNRLGIYDMSGNVREWCWDWYGVPISAETPATGISTGSRRVQRGGSWGGYTGDKAFICSVSYCYDRNKPLNRDCSLSETASSVNSCFGFRIVQSVTE